jgi:hypothetical protein
LKKTNWKSESLALAFGMLMILVIFGDQAQIRVGNLDTIFGQTLYPLMDVIYPLASMAVFILYGKSKGAVKFRLRSNLLLLTFFAAQILIQLDDIFEVFNHPVILPNLWWFVVRLLYLFIAPVAFFAFGAACGKTS